MSTTMPTITVLSKAAQHNVAAMGGVLLANKPVVGGLLADGRPSSSLFYWSHSQFTDDFEFGLHSHEGFEIVTVVLEGANSHYDTATRAWADLVAGDVQIIASGSGVSHNEKVARGSTAFQIWFDPGYDAALHRPATYVDHRAQDFAWEGGGGVAICDIVGSTGPVSAITPGMTMRRVRVEAGAEALLSLPGSALGFVYVIDGEPDVAGAGVAADDLITVSGAADLAVTARSSDADLFVISVPEDPGYTPVRGR